MLPVTWSSFRPGMLSAPSLGTLKIAIASSPVKKDHLLSDPEFIDLVSHLLLREEYKIAV
jgi:hypothetical protein